MAQLNERTRTASNADTWAGQFTHDIGLQIRTWRQHRGLSVANLGQLTARNGHQVPQPVLTNLELGRRGSISIAEVVVSYEFNLQTNQLTRHMEPNPRAGVEHRFPAYRSKHQGEQRRVMMAAMPAEELADD